MAQQARGPPVHERWAHLRFSVIGQLLAAPPPKGELRAQIEALAGRQWRHPITGEPARFGFSTIERWFYRALKERRDPVGVLRRKVRANAGRQHAISDAVRQVVLAQYAAHKSWSVQLHHDNLVALAETRADLRPLPCYDTLRRFMKANGLDKRRRVTSRQTAGAERAEARLFDREIRSYEAEHVNGLWHWDCHHGSRKVLTERGEWQTPILFGVLDDRSRLDGSGRDRLEAGRVEAAIGAQNAQAGAEPLFGMRPAGEHGADQAFGVRPDLAGPTAEPIRRPLGVAPVGAGHMVGVRAVLAAHEPALMGADALTAMEDLDGSRGDPHVDLGADQRVRDRIEKVMDLDVVVEVDA